jgi:hypothetical protein
VRFAFLCQGLGLAALIAAGWLVDPILGVALLGAALLLVGVAQERAGPRG